MYVSWVIHNSSREWSWISTVNNKRVKLELNQSGELSSEYLLRRTIEKANESDVPNNKVVPVDCVDRSELKHDNKTIRVSC